MAKAQKPNEGKLNKNHKKAKSTHKDWYGFLRIGPDLLERIKAARLETQEAAIPRASPPSLDDGEAPF